MQTEFSDDFFAGVLRVKGKHLVRGTVLLKYNIYLHISIVTGLLY